MCDQPQLCKVSDCTTNRTHLTEAAADVVQDLYLREVRSYKAPPTKANDFEGHVHKFVQPKTPESPEESSIANGLKAYEEQEVEVEGRAAAGEQEDVVEDWFEDDTEEETKEASH